MLTRSSRYAVSSHKAHITNRFSMLPRTMRQLFLLCVAFATCEACARTRGGGGGGPGSAIPGSGSPGGETPGNTPEAPPKVCPPLMSFSPDPADSFQLVSPPTTTVSGDTTTATCPAAGTSFLLPDGTSTTAALSCSTATGTWSFDDGTAFDATTISVACGAKCAPCMVTAFDIKPELVIPPTTTDSTDQCNTPNSPMCADPGNPILIGANMDGTRFIGKVIVEPVMCVGGKWVDASNAVYDNIGCNASPSDDCGRIAAIMNAENCITVTGKACVVPTSVTPMPYTGTNALLGGQTTLSVVCPAEAPNIYLFLFDVNSSTTTTLTLNTPLSDEDANFLCENDPLYLNGGTSLSNIIEIACSPA